MSEHQARAVVRLVVEVRLSQPWGPNCPIDTVFRQAAHGALQEVNQALQGRQSIRIVGEPEVETVIVNERKPITPSES